MPSWHPPDSDSGMVQDDESIIKVHNNAKTRFSWIWPFGIWTISDDSLGESPYGEIHKLEISISDVLGVTRMDKIRNEYIRGTAQVGKFGEKTREARLRWYGHLRRKDDGYIGRRMLRMELPGKRKRGRPKRRFMDVVKEDMAEVEVTEEDTVDRRNWRKKIRCGDP